ncbi:MAG: hypothetical protein JNL80_12880 [Phycisphaerae bacterium]|jgi:hypothetical protein|nr:hypothetical protein [Phycisphaerae bacterium]
MSTISDQHTLESRLNEALAKPGPLQQALRQLDRLGRRARLLLLSRRAFGLVAAAVGVSACAVMVDWVFRFPMWFRLIGLLVGIAFFLSAAARLLVPAWRFRPTPTDLALRVERSAPALRGRLASGIEFALSDAGRESPLAERAMVDLAERLSGESLLSWLAPKRSLAELSTALMTVAVVGLASGLLPTHALIGAQRILLPFAGAEWPARTAVESLLAGESFHAKGEPFLLQARLSKGDDASERIVADVRVTRDDGSILEDSIVLTRQPDGRYERVLDGDPAAREVRVQFRSADAESEPHKVTFVPPPAVVSSRILIEPPSYAVGTIEPRTTDLGDGTDERATLREPVLVGSTAAMDVELNASLGTDAEAIAASMVRMTSGGSDGVTMPALEVQPSDPTRWTIRWRVEGSSVVELALRDSHGIGNTDEIAFHLEASEDRPPSCAVLTPATDESVLPTAVVPVQIEGRDDVGLVRFGMLVTRRAGDGGSSAGKSGAGSGQAAQGEAEAFGDSVTEASGTSVRRDEPLDLASLSVQAGDVLTLVAAAEDGFEFDGRRHERVVSPARTLRIISETELGKQVRSQLSAIRRQAIRLDEQQGELLAATQNGRFDPALERGQAQLSERIRVATETLDELNARVGRNRLQDDDLQATLDQGKDLLDTAARASGRSSEAMQKRREAQAKKDDAEAARQQKEAEAAQEDVRAELEDLVKLLDRDEDSWAMGRAIDRLREEIAELAEKTAEAGKRTVGQRPEELSPEDRTALEGLSTQQREVAQEAQELMDELRKRAEAIERTDKARAEAMREAARAGEEKRLQRNLEQAGDELQRNRIEQAKASQQQAMEALDQMKRGLEDIRKARAEELRRALESLEQSIDRLIRVSEDELIGLARITGPEDAEPIAERGRAMAKLAQNTQAVASEARAAGSEANPVARLLDRAADSHGGAVGHLRSTPVNLAEAKLAEERGLAFLKEARGQTQQTREQMERRETQKRKQEILAAYRRIFEKQSVVRDATVAARPADPKAKLDRRALIESRRLAILQGEVRGELDGVLQTHEDVRKSEAFREAHELLGGWASEASDRLGRGDLSEETSSVQSLVVETLAQLVEALNEELQETDDADRFQTPENQNGNSGQGGGGSGQPREQPAIPPVTELKLLRGLQVQILERTRRLDRQRESGDAAPRVDAELRAIADLQRRLLDAATEVVKKIEAQAPTGIEPQDGSQAVPPEEPQGETGGEPKAEPEPGADPAAKAVSKARTSDELIAASDAASAVVTEAQSDADWEIRLLSLGASPGMESESVEHDPRDRWARERWSDLLNGEKAETSCREVVRREHPVASVPGVESGSIGPSEAVRSDVNAWTDCVWGDCAFGWLYEHKDVKNMAC